MRLKLQTWRQGNGSKRNWERIRGFIAVEFHCVKAKCRSTKQVTTLIANDAHLITQIPYGPELDDLSLVSLSCYFLSRKIENVGLNSLVH